MLRKASMSGMLSDMLTASLARRSRSLVVNADDNGHPDLIVRGQYAHNSVKTGDTHGARNQWLWVFVHAIDVQASRPSNEGL
jgi:hypothetical protein